MPQFTAIVAAPLEEVWKSLLLKIEQPQHFVPGVTEVLLLEQTEDYVLRKMTVVTASSNTILKEKITFSPYTVRFLLLGHPQLEGYVDNVIEPVTPYETKMTFRMHWIDKETQKELDNYELVKNAVLKTKAYIEGV